jgi:tight adherence protein B
MIISPTPIIYALIFVAVILLVEGIYVLVFGKSISLNKRVNRRLELLDKGGRREDVLEQLRKEANQHRDSKGIPLYSLLATKAQRANIAFSPPMLLAMMGVATVVAFLGLSIATQAGLIMRIALAVGWA